MGRIGIVSLALALFVVWVSFCQAGDGAQGAAQQNAGADAAALAGIKSQIETLKADYEKRIKDLEAQVEALQLQMLRNAPETPAAASAAPQAGASGVQSILGALNPAMTVVGNFVARGDSRKVFNGSGNRIDNKLSLRETELDLRAAIDPYADGVVIASIASDSPGSYSATVEEAYVTIKKLPFQDRPPLGLKLKIGRFHPSFGASNIVHTHDLPQTFRSLPVQEFLGEDGFTQNGISGTFFVPTPWDKSSSLEATLQVLAGGDVAFSPDPASRMAYLGHLTWFRTFKDSHNLQVGWSSYFHPAGNRMSEADFHGIDFSYRWKPARLGEWKSFLLSSEVLFARHAAQGSAGADAGVGQGRPAGFSFFGQWQFNRRWYAGARWDRTDVVDSPTLTRRSLTPYFSYYFSEFLRFRLNYEQRWSDLSSENRRKSVFAELNFVFGSHPTEPYWVNK